MKTKETLLVIALGCAACVPLLAESTIVGPGPEYRHPLRGVSKAAGPLPLFEALNDEKGRRYVVGEGASAAGEDGAVETFSGIYFMNLVAGHEVAKPAAKLAAAAPGKLSPELAAALAAKAGTDQIDVTIDLERRYPGLAVELERRIAEGRIRTHFDYVVERTLLVTERRQRIAEAVRPAARAIAEAGGTVTYRCRNMPCLEARLPVAELRRLAERGDVVGMGLPPEVTSASVDGAAVRHGAQIAQFFDPLDPGSSAGFDGDGLDEASPFDDVVFAVLETAGYFDHPGFQEQSNWWQRIAGKQSCASDGCTQVLGFDSTNNHAMGVAGILFGDLTDGQGSFAESDRLAASGYSPEAVGHLYRFDSKAASIQALDHIAGVTFFPPDVVSNSWGYTESPRCSGASSVARAANRLYEDGIAVFAAAHNLGGSSSECRVTAPGSAIGAFTVGAHLSDLNGLPGGGDAIDVRTAGIYSSDGNVSSWGGNASQGQNRSIIDLTGPGRRIKKFISTGGISTSQGGVCCTSLATPTVASAAMSFIDHYRHVWGNFIDNPGSLYANMLLMGDRQRIDGKTTQWTQNVNVGFDHRWGAGRLRMRKFGDGGMDPPWQYFNGWTCISDGETWSFAVGDGPLSADYDAFKVAAYWYDVRHDGTGGAAGSVADVDLHLVFTRNGSDVVVASDIDASDNKAGIFYHDVGGNRVKIQFHGWNVSGHNDPLCGQDSIRVFFAYFAEDSDRESPTQNLATGEGIYREIL